MKRDDRKSEVISILILRIILQVILKLTQNIVVKISTIKNIFFTIIKNDESMARHTHHGQIMQHV